MKKEERDVLKKMRETDEWGMKNFGTLDSEKTIAILGDTLVDGSHRRRTTKGIRLAKTHCVIHGNNVMRPNVGGVSISLGTVLRLERDAWSMVK